MVWYRKFQGLMSFRVREALLVSSAYDAFVLEEDGPLAERLWSRFVDLNLNLAPRITHVSTAAQALDLLDRRRFDLVLTVVRLRDVNAAEFSRQVKEWFPNIPVVLLVFDEGDLREFPGGTAASTIDHVFLWTGDAHILLAAIKLAEDYQNVDHDTAAAGVPVILVVEDRLRSWSTFLPLLYPELLAQAQSLIIEGRNDLRRLVRMRARPKILLAETFDEGLKLYRRYERYLYALVSDVSVPRGGSQVDDAGLELARLVRAEKPGLPILLQSSDDVGDRARSLGARFLDKSSSTFAHELRNFLREDMGFGDFVFRLPDRTEVARAHDAYEMEQVLRHVPIASIAYHAANNHFCHWFKARSMQALAERVKPEALDRFSSTEQVRDYVLSQLAQDRADEQAGVITDFAARHTGPENRFVRIGRGSIGGKGRGLAYISAQIVARGLLERFPGLQVRIPKTIVIGTEEFDLFMEAIDHDQLLSLPEDTAITDYVVAKPLRQELRQQLEVMFGALHGPVAVRSSSLLEDSRFQPVTGIYATYMLPNNDPRPEVRFAELCRAIKAVYASTYWHEARGYVSQTPHDLDKQKMGIVIQQVAGRAYGNRYYPHLSGVARSYNSSPLEPQRAEDGVVAVSLGLGQMVVEGGTSLTFSPNMPTILPQFPDLRALVERSQRQFYALDLSQSRIDLHAGPDGSLVLCDLADAEADHTLHVVGSVYSEDDESLRDNLDLPGRRVVTFNNVLKWTAIPLAAALRELLQLFRQGMGGEVELEFSVDMGDWGRTPPLGRRLHTPRLYLLQVRPLAVPGA